MPTSSDSQATATITLRANLHARPAGQLARTAAGFASTITVEHNGRAVNPTGVLAVMGLGAIAGSTITITADGHDAAEAVQVLTEVLAGAQ